MKMKIVNLEEGLPSVPQTLAKLKNEIQASRAAGVTILKFIHGYGSSGIGGDLRIAVQASLRGMEQRQEIAACIYGENWNVGDERAWSLMKRFPSLKSDRDLGRGNKGITIVVL